MMKNLGTIVRTAIAAALGMGVLVFALGAAKSPREARSTFESYRGFLPASQIISFDDTVGLLDTTTGAVYRLVGNLDNPSTRPHWELRVGPVSDETSGYLEIQRPTFSHDHPEAAFLVDVMTGQTWLLTRRASSNGRWDRLDTYR